MSDSNFADIYEAVIMSIEDAIDELETDVDYETVNGILTITAGDGSQIIITPQSATSELWVAARSGGFHFGLNEGVWCSTRSGERLESLLDRVFTEQIGSTLGL